MDRFIGGEHVDVDILTTDLEKAVARGHFHPVMGHAVTAANVGSELILDLIVRAFPSPTEHPMPTVSRIDGSPAEPITADPDGPLVAEIIKTTSDPYVGKVSIVRVFSGTLDERCRSSTCPGTSPPAPATRTTISTSASVTSAPSSAASSPTSRRPWPAASWP